MRCLLNRLIGIGVLNFLLLTLIQSNVDATEPVPTTVLESTPAGALAFSPDSNWLAIGSEYNGPLKLWKVDGTTKPRVIENVKAKYHTIAFSPDGKMLTACRFSLEPAGAGVSVWTADGKKRLMDYT